MPVIDVNEQEAVFEYAAGDTLLRAGLRAGLGMPYECGVGACGCCRCEVLEGDVADLWPAAPGLSERDRRKGRVLACQSRPQGDARIRLRLDPRAAPALRPARRTATLAAVREITHDIREFVFRSDAPADFLPGQYALLALPGLDRERAYSMANLPNAAGEWHFRIRRVAGGGASEALFAQLASGAVVGLDGPYGLAHLRTDSPRDIVCIAGGSGLAPMLSVARGVAAEPALAGRKLDFFYGGRTPADICGQPELAVLPGFGDTIRYHAAVSDADAAVRGGWPGPVGPIHELLAATLGARLGEAEFYLAGPPPMVEALQQLLQLRHKLPPSASTSTVFSEPMETDDLIGALAGCLSTAAFLPQAWQIWKSRSARDVSWAMYAVLIAGVGLWIVYGLRRGALPLVLTNGVILVLALLILAMKRRFGD